MSDSNADYVFKNFLKISTAIGIVVAFIFILSPFLIPLLLGGILAMAFSPFVAYFLKKGWNRRISVSIISLIISVLVLAPITIVFVRGTKIITPLLNEELLIGLKDKIQYKAYTIIDHFSELYNIDSTEARTEFDSFVTKAGVKAISILSGFLSDLLKQIPNLAMLSFITILSFYFFLLDEVRVRKWFDRFFNFSNDNGDKFISLMKAACNEVFFSNVLTGFTQASIVTAGAFFTHVGDIFIVFFCTFFLSFIPIIGAAPMAFLLALITFLDGRMGAGIALVVIGLVTGVADNLLRPYLSSRGEVNVPLFVSFLSIVGGVLVMGLPGLFLGPLLASLTYGALPIIFDEYFHKTGQVNENNS